MVGEPTDKKQKERPLKRSTTICPTSLLAFSDFERAIGLSPTDARIHRVIKFFFVLQDFMMFQVKLSVVLLTHVIPLMHCYVTWKHQNCLMFCDVSRRFVGVTVGGNGLVNLYYSCNEYGGYWANSGWFSGFIISS